jgi:hypothetical protein
MLLHCPIPSLKQLQQLTDDFGQQWFDGCQSVVDERNGNQGSKRFPLWVITFWKLMVKIRNSRAEWVRAVHWVNTETEERQKKGDHESVVLLEEVNKVTGLLPWDAPMDFERGNVNTKALGRFLGTQWMSDTHINMMVHAMSERLQQGGGGNGKRVLIAALTFTYDILSVDRKLKLPAKQWAWTVLIRYQHRIEEEIIEELYFPLHVNENHWIAGRIDFKNNTISYGKPGIK